MNSMIFYISKMVVRHYNYILLELVAMFYFLYKVYTKSQFDYMDWFWISELIKYQYE